MKKWNEKIVVKLSSGVQLLSSKKFSLGNWFVDHSFQQTKKWRQPKKKLPFQSLECSRMTSFWFVAKPNFFPRHRIFKVGPDINRTFISLFVLALFFLHWFLKNACHSGVSAFMRLRSKTNQKKKSTIHQIHQKEKIWKSKKISQAHFPGFSSSFFCKLSWPTPKRHFYIKLALFKRFLFFFPSKQMCFFSFILNFSFSFIKKEI